MVPQLRESEAALVHREGERTRSRRERGDVVKIPCDAPTCEFELTLWSGRPVSDAVINLWRVVHGYREWRFCSRSCLVANLDEVVTS